MTCMDPASAVLVPCVVVHSYTVLDISVHRTVKIFVCFSFQLIWINDLFLYSPVV